MSWEESRAKSPGRSFAPGFRLWDAETALGRMFLKLSQPWPHRLNWNSCPWLASAKESWAGSESKLQRSIPSRRLRGLIKRRQPMNVQQQRLKSLLSEDLDWPAKG